MLSRSEIMGVSLRSGEPRKRYPLFRVNGEPSRTRTCDPLVKSQLLYQLSYRPIYMQRAREGVLLLRGTSRGILPKLSRIGQPAADSGINADLIRVHL